MNDAREQVTARFFEPNLPAQVKLMSYAEYRAKVDALVKRHKDDATLNAAIENMLKKAREELREQLLADVKKQAAAAELTKSAAEGKSIRDAHDLWLREGKAADLTQDSLDARLVSLRSCFKVLGLNDSDEVSTIAADIDIEFLPALREKYAASSCEKYHKMLHQWLKWCREEGFTDVQHKYIRQPPVQYISKSLTTEEAERVVLLAENLDERLHYYHSMRVSVQRVILMLRYTGMRLNELYNLKLSDIYLDGRDRMPSPHVLVGSTIKTKTGKRSDARQANDKGTVRSVAAPRLLNYLREDLKNRRPHEVWFLDNGYGQKRWAFKGKVTKSLRRFLGKLGITDVQPCHVFRHTAAIELHENGVDLPLVQHFLGHSNPNTTASRYMNTERIQRGLGDAAQLLS